MTSKRVRLANGLAGQDSACLAWQLLDKRNIAHGIKRRSSSFNTGRVGSLYVDPHEGDTRFFMLYLTAANLMRLVLDRRPDEIDDLAARSHVQGSFEKPEFTANAGAIGTLRLPEAVRLLKLEKSQPGDR